MAAGTYQEWCASELMTIDFRAEDSKLGESIEALVDARKVPPRAVPRDGKTNECDCGTNRGTYDHTKYFGGYDKLRLNPKQPFLDSHIQRECVFTHCSTTLTEVVKQNPNVYACSGCSQFVCHSCKQKFVPDDPPRQRKRTKR